MFFVVVRNIHRRSFLSLRHLIIHPVQEWSGPQRQFWFCFNISNDELLWPYFSLTVHNGLSRSIIFLSFRIPKAQSSIVFFPRTFWRRRWQSWGSPCNETHHWPRLRCDSFFTWILLRSFCHPYCRTVWLILNKHKKWFYSSCVKFPLVSMSARWFLVSNDVLDLDFGVQIDSIE